MTACTNNGGSRARRAVTAALVGVLSVGAAPMVALATGAAPASGDVQVMADENPAFQLGTVNYADGEEAGAVYSFDGKAHGLVPESVSAYNAPEDKFEVVDDASAASKTDDKAYYYYVKLGNGSGASTFGAVKYKDADGDLVTVKGEYMTSKPTEVGTYAVVVGLWDTATNKCDAYVSVADTFTITDGKLSSGVLYQVNASDPADVSDTEFSYDGISGNASWGHVESTMGVLVDGKAVSVSKDGCVEKDTGIAVSASDNLKPGTTYVVKVSGNGTFEGQSASLEFTYQPLDLSSAVVVSQGVYDSASSIVTTNLGTIVQTIDGTPVNGANFGGNDRLSWSLTESPDGDMFVDGVGEYTWTITQSQYDKDNGGYVTGTATATVILANVKVTSSISNTNGSTIDPTKPSTYFDEDKVTATYNSEPIKVTCTYVDEDGNDVTLDEVNSTPGTYTVTAKVYEKVDGDLVAGIRTYTVKTEYGVTESANIFVSFDGHNITNLGSYSGTVYDGTDQSSKLSVKVSYGDKTFEEGSDYTVTIKNGDGDVVDSMTDADTYTIEVKSDAFTATGTYEVVIGKRTLSKIVPSDAFASEVVDPRGDTYLGGGKTDDYVAYYYSYSGEEIVPEYTFLDADGNEWTLAADEYEVKYTLGSDTDAELKAEGTYTLTSAAVEVDSKNFTGTLSTLRADGSTLPARIVVTTASSFVDVPNDAWYAEAVATAKQQNYIVGLNGSNFFAPMNSMTRADVVCVLYRMAGGTVANEGLSQEESSYVSGFSDVDQHAYYAKAVAWATRAGIVRGYGDTFGTERDVSTEEFATMLARYAALMGDDTSVDTDAVLSGVADGDQVSSYARDAVAWAVENGYVASNGNLIDPQGSVYRARVVTIAVRYQPEQLHVIL